MIDTFDILAKDYRPMVKAYVQALIHDVHLAEDVTQETFIEAHKIIERFDSDKDFGAWLRGIARNKVLHHRRSTARRPLVIDSRVVDGVEEVFGMFDTSNGRNGPWLDRLNAVKRCIQTLNDNLRSAMTHVYEQGLTLQQAADKLAITFDAMGQRISRARTQVRRCVDLKSGDDL